MKALILIALLSLIYCEINVNVIDSVTFKCPDEKLKLKDDLCAIYLQDHELDASGNDNANPVVLYIKKKCGKNQHCIEYDSVLYSKYYEPKKYEDFSYFTCQKSKLKKLKLNKKCSLNSECLTGICKNNKCSTLDPCLENENCGKGKYCYKSGSTNTCKSYLNEGETCSITSSSDKCSNGLECYSDDSTATTGKCTKLFSLDVDAKNVQNSELCKTGIVSDSNICVTFYKYDSDTSKVLCKDGNNKEVECYITEIDDDTFTDKNGDSVTIYSQGKFDLLGDIIERYNKIKLNKLNEKEEAYDYAGYYGDKKFAELKAVFDNYAPLLDQGLIKANGKKNGDNKCEYEFWKSTISSSYINACLGFALAVLSLLL